MPITLSTRSKGRTVLSGSWFLMRLEAWVSVYVHSVYFVMRVDTDTPSKGSYQACIRLRNLKSGKATKIWFKRKNSVAIYINRATASYQLG
jgi:hypothetical protein